jgi:hypothetical protein
MTLDDDDSEFPQDILLSQGACLATPDDPGIFPEKTQKEIEIEERRTMRFVRSRERK